MQFGDSQYPLVMASLFSTPDKNLLKALCGTVYLCDPTDKLVVIPISSIQSTVTMFPEMVVSEDGHIEWTGKFSLMRHPYIKLTKYSTDGFGNDNNKSSEGEESGESKE